MARHSREYECAVTWVASTSMTIQPSRTFPGDGLERGPAALEEAAEQVPAVLPAGQQQPLRYAGVGEPGGRCCTITSASDP